MGFNLHKFWDVIVLFLSLGAIASLLTKAFCDWFDERNSK